jgi:glycine/D-amino acid oxidase-like deaminating enzyme
MKQILIISILLISLISCQNSTKIEDVVIIGGGLLGSSTGWELSKSDEKVLLIEQQDSIYTFGSSFGEARISRSLGAKDDIFSFLQQCSVDETKKLIEYLNESGNGEQHSMDDIYRTSPVTYIRYKSQKKEVDLLLEDQQDKYEFAPDMEKARALFGMEIPDSVMIVREYKKYSGTLNPKILISKLHQGIKFSGSKVLYNEKVISLKRSNDLYEIQIKNTVTGNIKSIISKKVVASAGPYNGELVKEIAPYFEKLINPKRLFLAFLKINPIVYNNLLIEQKNQLKQSYPVADINSEIFYSMIENYDKDGLPILKVGGHFLRTDIRNLDKVWEKELSQKEIDWSKTNTLRYLKMLNLIVEYSDLDFIRGYSCVYSLTKSEIPYVTNIIKQNKEVDPNFVLVGGMSGVGAKGSLTYGLIAANLLLNKDDTSAIYQKTKLALGIERLEQDLSALNE